MHRVLDRLVIPTPCRLSPQHRHVAPRRGARAALPLERRLCLSVSSVREERRPGSIPRGAPPLHPDVAHERRDAPTRAERSHRTALDDYLSYQDRATAVVGLRKETETSPNAYIKEAQSKSFDPVNRIGDLLPMPT